METDDRGVSKELSFFFFFLNHLLMFLMPITNDSCFNVC